MQPFKKPKVLVISTSSSKRLRSDMKWIQKMANQGESQSNTGKGSLSSYTVQDAAIDEVEDLRAIENRLELMKV